MHVPHNSFINAMCLNTQTISLSQSQRDLDSAATNVLQCDSHIEGFHCMVT